MPAPVFGRSALALLMLAAAAPATMAQSHPRWQVEASLDQTGSTSMHAVIVDGTTSGGELNQRETVRYSIGASRLAVVAPRTSLRFGLSLANKGFTEHSSIYSTAGMQETEREVTFLYLGAPLTVGYNLTNPHRGLKPFVEAGVVPELLVREDESAFAFDLREVGLSYLFNVGVKYNLENGRALVLAPEARIAAREYSRATPGTLEFRPVSIGIKLGVQF